MAGLTIQTNKGEIEFQFGVLFAAINESGANASPDFQPGIYIATVEFPSKIGKNRAFIIQGIPSEAI